MSQFPMLLQLETQRQLLRYAVTGLAANAVLYAGYLLLASHGVGHKVAMTITYCSSVLCTFVFNRRWTFGHDGAVPATLSRYLATYVFGYALNLLALALLVDVIGLPHRGVMAALIVISAAVIFVVQKHWVFTAERAGVPG